MGGRKTYKLMPCGKFSLKRCPQEAQRKGPAPRWRAKEGFLEEAWVLRVPAGEWKGRVVQTIRTTGAQEGHLEW